MDFMEDGASSAEAMYRSLGIDEPVFRFGEQVLSGLRERFEAIDKTAEINQLKVLHAMQEARVSEAHLMGSSGYGYHDIGRDTLEEVYAKTFHTEDALVRPQITCGTHALRVALFGNLRPGNILYSPAGSPYDTLEEVIGIRPSEGSLAEYGIGYRQTDLTEAGGFDYPAIEAALADEKIALVTIQRSRGYQTRPSFSVEEIGALIRFIKARRCDLPVMVDNCYGEFTETAEPTDVGADMAVGSLIKNPGGGLVPSGGYIVGTKRAVSNAAHCLTSPGLGKEVGASLTQLPAMYQGFFLSPTVTAAAVKGAVFAAAVYERLGVETTPFAREQRHDIIQAIVFHHPEMLRAFCEGIQAAAPIDAHVCPVPSDMPGYDAQVIMAAGTFVSGSSIELSADGPLREPYSVFFQGGLSFPHAKLGILKSVQRLTEYGFFKDFFTHEKQMTN